LSEQSQKSGMVVSGALHGALLAAIVIGFSSAPKFDGAGETIPVETITQNQFNEIMKGKPDAKPVEKPVQPVEASAPKPEQKAEADPPPPPPQKIDSPTPPQAAPAAPTPPARPAPAAREAPAPPTPPAPLEAEVDRPQARPDPQPPPTPPAPPARPKAIDKPKPDQLAKLVDDAKPEEPPKPPAKVKTETPNDAHRVFDANSIAKLLGQGKPRNVEQVASATPLGSPTQSATRMSPSMSAAIDGWLTDAYLRCWQPPPTMPEGAKYVAEIRVSFNADGSLSAHPALINPPSDPAWRAYADSAMRAVLRCNPLQVPPQYAPFFEQWRNKTVHFDPENALG
jgi:colicin import membrane protein